MKQTTKMTIDVPVSWHKMIKLEAVQRDTTITRLIQDAVIYYLNQFPKEANSNGEEKRE